MSWTPPEFAKPRCRLCVYREFHELGVGEFKIPVMVCQLRHERRFIFRKNPPRPNSEALGSRCKRYVPTMAASSPQGDGWVEVASIQPEPAQ